MAAPKVATYPHIVRDPDILAGEPTIAGMRIAVRNIVERSRYTRTIEDLRATYDALSRAQIEEALAFYGDHRAEIDRYIAENNAALTADGR